MQVSIKTDSLDVVNKNYVFASGDGRRAHPRKSTIRRWSSNCKREAARSAEIMIVEVSLRARTMHVEVSLSTRRGGLRWRSWKCQHEERSAELEYVEVTSSTRRVLAEVTSSTKRGHPRLSS